MRCWGCRAPIRSRSVDRDSIIRGRERSRGGPYRLYRCPRCLKENKIEENGRGRRFASPPKEISLLDFLFGWIETLAPEDFLRIIEWQEESGEARRNFFEAGGDRRYSGGPIRRGVRRLGSWFRRRPTVVPPNERTSSSDPVRSIPAPPPATRTVPHPFRILGVAPDASEEEIRQAFRELARRWHPDKQRDPGQVEEATRRWKELMRAYESIVKRGS